MLFHWFYDSKLWLFMILNFAIIEAIMAGTYSLKPFLKNTPGTEKHKNK